MTGLDAVKAATWKLHTTAERSGIIAEILAGRADRFSVALLLRNLLPIYKVLDSSVFGHPALVRSSAIEADLQVLAPNENLPLLPEGVTYGERVRQAATEGDASGLLGHAYVRYLGDLNGGLIMKRRLVACLGEIAQNLAFHEYPDLADKARFSREYRMELDRGVRAADLDLVVQEASVAFEMNIMVSEAVQKYAAMG